MTSTNTSKYSAPNPIIILIGGPSGSGKSELSKQLAAIFDATVVEMDRYFLDSEKVPVQEIVGEGFQRQWEAPGAFDIDRMLLDIELLMRERMASVPTYDYRINKRVGFCEIFRNGNIVVIEGIQALYLRQKLENMGVGQVLSLYIDADVNMRERIISTRDADERGKPDGQELRRKIRLVGEDCWILPQKDTADFVLLREDVDSA